MSNLGASSTSISGSGSGSVISLGSSCSSNWTIRKKKHDRNLQSLQDILQKAVQKATQSLYIEASVGSKNSQEKNTTPVESISLSIWSNHADSPLCIWPFFTYTRCELPHQHVPKLFTQFCTEFYKIPPTPNISNIQTPKFNGPNSFRSSDGRSSFNGGSGGWK